jgi:hypothetical protein
MGSSRFVTFPVSLRERDKKSLVRQTTVFVLVTSDSTSYVSHRSMLEPSLFPFLAIDIQIPANVLSEKVPQ